MNADLESLGVGLKVLTLFGSDDSDSRSKSKPSEGPSQGIKFSDIINNVGR